MSPERFKGPRRKSLERQLVDLIHSCDGVEYIGTIKKKLSIPGIGEEKHTPNTTLLCGLSNPSLELLSASIATVFNFLSDSVRNAVPTAEERNLLEPESDRREFRMLFAERDNAGSIKNTVTVAIYYDPGIARAILEDNRKINRRKRNRS